MNEKLKIAIHKEISIQESAKLNGLCIRIRYVVVVGRNPLGPRGGHCGNYVDGRPVDDGDFVSFEKARKFARLYSIATGHTLLL